MSWVDASGPRQAVSDANGIVSLGKPPKGMFELTVDTRGIAGATGKASSQRLIALLLPGGQGALARVVTHMVAAGASQRLHIRLEIAANSRVTAINWGDGNVFTAADFALGGSQPVIGDVTGDAYAQAFGDLPRQEDSADIRIAFATAAKGPR